LRILTAGYRRSSIIVYPNTPGSETTLLPTLWQTFQKSIAEILVHGRLIVWPLYLVRYAEKHKPSGEVVRGAAPISPSSLSQNF
jgi:hypothetical protein